MKEVVSNNPQKEDLSRELEVLGRDLGILPKPKTMEHTKYLGISEESTDRLNAVAFANHELEKLGEATLSGNLRLREKAQRYNELKKATAQGRAWR